MRKRRGGIEAATEKLPLDTLAAAFKLGGKSAVRSLFRQAGVEAGEESVSYVVNYLADKLARDQQARFSWQELGLSAAGGALSGGVMGGGAMLAGSAMNGTRGADVPNQSTAATAPSEGEFLERGANSLTLNGNADGSAGTSRNIETKGKNQTLNDLITKNRDTFAQNGVLAQVNKDTFSKKDIKMIDQITEFFKSIGNKVVRRDFGEVVLTRSGARDSISHGMGPEKVAAFSALPNVIQNGQVIDEQLNWKGRGYDTVTFGGRIQIDGVDYDMGVIVKRYDNPGMASKYYLHEVLLTPEKAESRRSTGTLSGNPSDVIPPSDVSIAQAGGKSNITLLRYTGIQIR